MVEKHLKALDMEPVLEDLITFALLLAELSQIL